MSLLLLRDDDHKQLCLLLCVLFFSFYIFLQPVSCTWQASNLALAGDPNVTIVQTAIQNYATFLNTQNCKGWVALFAPDGIKYDPPRPSIGSAELMVFCEQTYVQFPSFTYTLVGPVLVTKSAGYRAVAQWMLGGTDNTSTAYVQNGFGSFVFDNDLLIATATGYNMAQNYGLNTTSSRVYHTF